MVIGLTNNSYFSWTLLNYKKMKHKKRHTPIKIN